ncbi:MAG: Flp pilus assembly protein CpaB [Alphaproteobacteria bacterium 64-11]|mgnify:CR=1 FL=1|nr:Flp pilus assembly protein CpaB [Alphaproteobacteria bacterium]OJU08051.1 MAG: Flp pilus assembly protein CpaB [Alphaproteobacteria bacterium 64-11]
MNTQRMIVLGLALVAAAGAAFLVRGMLGGGTPAVDAKPAPAIAMSEVLVASENLQPGQAVQPEQVRWEKWPAGAVDSSFITHNGEASAADAIKGTVVRSPILAGQPVVNTAIVHADAAGFMAAMLTPGMRAVSIVTSPESGAAGFILPNDRIDVILTRKINGDPPRVSSQMILSNVRVLAVDQTFKQEKDTKTVVAKTATLEVTPQQAEILSTASQAGQLSLALRALGDNQAVSTGGRRGGYATGNGQVSVIRYGVIAANGSRDRAQESPQ